MLKMLQRLMLSMAALVLAAWAVTFFGPPGLVPRVLGTGGYVPTVVMGGPRAFAFDRPKLWNDRTDRDGAPGAGWGAFITGPQTDEGVRLTQLAVIVAPTASRTSEHPAPSGPYVSFDDFRDRALPVDRKLVATSSATVDGRQADEVISDYTACEPYSANPRCIRVRSRAVLFEDRGYYYMLSLEARDAEYDRYVEVFDRMVSSFRFLD